MENSRPEEDETMEESIIKDIRSPFTLEKLKKNK